MKQLYPDTYQNEPGLEIAGTLKKLFQYTTQDALHNDFDVAYDNFVAGNAAMIPNGYWMIDKIPEEMQKKSMFFLHFLKITDRLTGDIRLGSCINL